MCNFRVGQKVVCVAEKGFEGDEYPFENFPKHMEVYTVRSVETDETGDWLLLDEIVNDPFLYEEGFGEASFHCSGFRPVVERKTDISIFKAMLNNTPQKVTA